MPVYQCRECNGNIDPTEQVRCPSCNEKKPLSCSKCNEPINHHDIHGIEKLRTKRPLLCKACGNDNEVVKCPLCKIAQPRSNGVTVSQVEGANVYHKACLNKRREVIRYANMAAPASAAMFVIIAFLVQSSSKAAFFGCLVTAAVLFVAIRMFRTIIEPR